MSLGPIAQSVASSTEDPGVVSSILVWSHTFEEIDHGHSSPSADHLDKLTQEKRWLGELTFSK